VHDKLFSLQTDPSVEAAAESELNPAALTECLSPATYDDLRRRASMALELGFRSTPTVLIGYIQHDEFIAADVFSGARPIKDVSKMIDRRLASIQ